ncbi:ATP-dependent metallopeptidase FtsH/Yme1/Tma family protein, partial [Pseudomonas aeruginosa]|uniref:ATP-dependent metallopeptidase FtsH/Yme1/Tma family protein n=1 Tax=Pseudomonas aeruginosa TaxID=287 RepID=UPI001AD69257
MVKNTLLWLVVIGVLVLVFSGFDQSSEPDSLNYSEFVTAVSENQVASVEIDGEQITGEKKNGSSFETIRPAVTDDQLMPILRENQVEVQGTAPKRQSVLMQLLIASFPILLIIGLFLF